MTTSVEEFPVRQASIMPALGADPGALRAPLPPLRRLLVVGLFVPVLFSAVDAWLWRLQFESSNSLLVAITMAVFVVQVGFLGWLCGRWIENPRWRWGLYAWGWVLVDLQLCAASDFTKNAAFWRPEQMLPGSLFAAQAGLAMVWGILGSTRWTLRIPICTLLVFGFVMLSRGGNGMVREMVPVQLLALGALCGLLRLRRFVLQPIAAVPAVALANASSPGLPTTQFSIRHVLIWTTSLAVLLGMLRALEILSLDSLDSFCVFNLMGLVSLLSLGLAVAITFVVAVWAALGAGNAWLRLTALGLTLPMAGLTTAVLYWHAGRNAWARGVPFSDLWNKSWEWEHFWNTSAWLAVWVALAGSLLFASLIILRTIGYRLVRTARKSSAGPAA